MNTFYHYILICFSIVASYTKIESQSGWTAPVAANYAYSANVVAVFKLDGVLSNSNQDQIAFFFGNEIRGLKNGLTIPNLGTLYFITTYSNQANQILSSKVYHAASNAIYTAQTTINFVPQSVTGTAGNPFQVIAFSNNDAPIDLLPIPPQTTMSVFPFHKIPLRNYLVQTDNDPIAWTTNTNTNLTVNIQDDSLMVTAANGFTGQTTLRLKATEQTANQYKDSVDIIFNVNEMYEDPTWIAAASQGIVQGTTFSNANLNDFEDGYNGDCLAFDYFPIFDSNNSPEQDPAWQAPNNLQYNMSLNARVRFTPKYYYHHPNDRLAAFINSQLVGVASPTVVNGSFYFFLTISNATTSGVISFKFFDGALQKTRTPNTTLNFSPNSIVGTIANPYTFEFAPIVPNIDTNNILHMTITNASWLGEQSFEITTFDCNYPQILNDTTVANFCVNNNSANLNVYYKDLDNDGYGDGFATVYCDRPLGFKLQSELTLLNDDCDDNEPLLNINPAITISDKCFVTIKDAIDAAELNDIIMVHANVNSTENNILPAGITIQVEGNATWTNNGTLTNRGLIHILGNVRFVNGANGIYKGKGVLSGSMLNYGTMRPGE